MVYILGILICLAAGFLAVRKLTDGKLNPILHLLFALALGLGIVSTATFYIHILLGLFNRWVPVGTVLAAIALLGYSLFKKPPSKTPKKLKKSKSGSPIKAFGDDDFILNGDDNIFSPLLHMKFTQEHIFGFITLGGLALPLIITANHFPLGGWDAWSCWNLKAKFIFLGQENWKDILAPGLWRSNTHYPLLWPLVNVWFWDLGNRFDQAVPMLNSIVIALLTAGILLFGLLELTGALWPSILAAVMVTALPFGVVLLISQYSDSLLGLYLMSAFMALLLAEKYKLPNLKILSMVFLGLMSFTKNEGLIAAAFAALLIFWHERANKKELKGLIFAFFMAALPTVIFTLFMAPKNEAFINGLVSTDKPTNLSRIMAILAYPWFEFISGKWHGLWFLGLGGILLGGKKLWQSSLGLIGLSLVCYLGVVMVYYAVNTFFEINWWLSTTLSRILFALTPTIALWISLGLRE